MARTFTPRDCHALMNLLVKEATGQDAAIQVVDSSTFASAGETVLNTGVENTLNALSIVIGKTLMAVRPYEAKLKIVQAINSDLYSQRLRKISVYNREAQSSGDWNTQLNPENLMDGAENTSHGTPDSGSACAVGSMFEQNKPVLLEMNFGGQSVWQDSTTIYEYQLKPAMTNEADFSALMEGILTERTADIESQKESYNRLAIIQHIAGVYDMSASMPGSVINLTKAYNDRFGTSHTSAELRSTYLDSFLKFFVSEFKLASDKMTYRTDRFHWTPTISGHTLLRNTPKDKQRALLFSPLFTEAKAWVMPEIFNPEYLALEQHESVMFWQNFNDPSAVKCKPAIPDVSDPSEQKAGSEVNLPYVVGCLYDVDALMVDYQLERSATTPLEARKGYRCVWWTFSRNIISDFTENFILFTMEDE